MLRFLTSRCSSFLPKIYQLFIGSEEYWYDVKGNEFAVIVVTKMKSSHNNCRGYLKEEDFCPTISVADRLVFLCIFV